TANFKSLSPTAVTKIFVIGIRKAGIGLPRTPSKARCIGTERTASGSHSRLADRVGLHRMLPFVTFRFTKRRHLPNGGDFGFRQNLNGKLHRTNSNGENAGNGRTAHICRIRDLKKAPAPSANITANSW